MDNRTLENNQDITVEQVKSTWNYKTGNMSVIQLSPEIQKQFNECVIMQIVIYHVYRIFITIYLCTELSKKLSKIRKWYRKQEPLLLLF